MTCVNRLIRRCTTPFHSCRFAHSIPLSPCPRLQEVSDNGPGVSPQCAGMLFQAFSQLPTAVAGGSGLGLLLCKQLVELSGGEIGLVDTSSSSNGSGSGGGGSGRSPEVAVGGASSSDSVDGAGATGDGTLLTPSGRPKPRQRGARFFYEVPAAGPPGVVLSQAEPPPHLPLQSSRLQQSCSSSASNGGGGSSVFREAAAALVGLALPLTSSSAGMATANSAASLPAELVHSACVDPAITSAAAVGVGTEGGGLAACRVTPRGGGGGGSGGFAFAEVASNYLSRLLSEHVAPASLPTLSGSSILVSGEGGGGGGHGSAPSGCTDSMRSEGSSSTIGSGSGGYGGDPRSIVSGTRGDSHGGGSGGDPGGISADVSPIFSFPTPVVDVPPPSSISAVTADSAATGELSPIVSLSPPMRHQSSSIGPAAVPLPLTADAAAPTPTTAGPEAAATAADFTRGGHDTLPASTSDASLLSSASGSSSVSAPPASAASSPPSSSGLSISVRRRGGDNGRGIASSSVSSSVGYAAAPASSNPSSSVVSASSLAPATTADATVVRRRSLSDASTELMGQASPDTIATPLSMLSSSAVVAPLGPSARETTVTTSPAPSPTPSPALSPLYMPLTGGAGAVGAISAAGEAPLTPLTSLTSGSSALSSWRHLASSNQHAQQQRQPWQQYVSSLPLLPMRTPADGSSLSSPAGSPVHAEAWAATSFAGDGDGDGGAVTMDITAAESSVGSVVHRWNNSDGRGGGSSSGSYGGSVTGLPPRTPCSPATPAAPRATLPLPPVTPSNIAVFPTLAAPTPPPPAQPTSSRGESARSDVVTRAPRSLRRAVVADDSMASRALLARALVRAGVGEVQTAVDGLEAVNLARRLLQLDQDAQAGVAASTIAAPSAEPSTLSSSTSGTVISATASSRGSLAVGGLHNVDAWLLDGEMPRMGGGEATSVLRALGVTAPILIVTGTSGDAEEAAFLAAGADAVLRKPVDRASLHAAIARVGLVVS